MPKVTIYIRNHKTREYEIADPKTSYPQGTIWCLRYKRDGQRKWETLNHETHVPGAGMTYSLARAIAKIREGELELQKPTAPVPSQPNRVEIDPAITLYLTEVMNTKSDKTYTGYRSDLLKFRASCKKQFLDQITEADLQKFVNDLRASGLGKRTIYNVFQGVNTFLRASKVLLGGNIIQKLGREYDEKVVRAYTEEELKALFDECDEDERIVFKFFLASGCREGEVAHTEWRDLDFVHNKLHIQPKPEWRWKIKDKEDRFVPMPPALMAELQSRKNGAKAMDLVFPNSFGRPEGHFLRMLQDIAKRGGLEGNWELHQFRKTFATRLLRSGKATVRDIQQWLGHYSLEVTQAYLKGAEAESETAQTAASTAFAAFA
jgi:integrase